MAQIPATQARHIGYLSARPLPPLSNIALAVAVVLAKWAERRRTRMALADLDAHLLRDVGLTHDEAFREARRAFWRE